MRNLLNLVTSTVAIASSLVVISQVSLAAPRPLQHGTLQGEISSTTEDIRLPGTTQRVLGDEYTLQVNEDDQVEFQVTPGLGNLDPVLWIVSPDGQQRQLDDPTSATAPELFNEFAPTTGNYRLIIYDYSGAGIGRYSLRVNHRRNGSPVNSEIDQAEQTLRQLGLALTPCSPGAIQIQISNTTRCALPIPQYPLDRSPFRYDAATQTLISSVPDPSPTTPLDEFKANYPGIREVPCGVSNVAEILLNGQILLCTRDLDAGQYNYDAVSRRLTSLATPPPPSTTYRFSCEPSLTGTYSLQVSASDDREATFLTISRGTSTMGVGDRCNIISSRLQNLVNTNRSQLDEVELLAGTLNGVNVLCAGRNIDSCTSSDLLFTVDTSITGEATRVAPSGSLLTQLFNRILR